MAEFARTDLDQMAVAAVEPETGNIRRLPGRMPGPLEIDELNQPGEFGASFHRFILGNWSPPMIQYNRSSGNSVAEMPHRVDRVTHASALQFDLRYLEPFVHSMAVEAL